MSREDLNKKSFVAAGMMAVATGIAGLASAVEAIQNFHNLVCISSIERGFIVYYEVLSNEQ